MVTCKPLTERKGNCYSPYAHSKPDVNFMHRENAFKSGIVRSATIGSSVLVNETEEMDEGSVCVYSAVLECKTGRFAIHQMLANMLCTATDITVEFLGKEKQVNQAVVYGLPVNYSTGKIKIMKLTLDFQNNCYRALTLENEMDVAEGLNFVATVLGN